MCCFAVSQLLIFGKSIISTANKTEDEDPDEEKVKIEWPEDVLERAKIIRVNAQTMTGYVEAVSNSFITGQFPSICISILDFSHIDCDPITISKVSTIDLLSFKFEFSKAITDSSLSPFLSGKNMLEIIIKY